MESHAIGAPREIERWWRAFQRYKDKMGLMDKSTFIKLVLGPSVPLELADRIFRVFGNSQQGVSWRDFVCNLVVFLKVPKYISASYVRI